MALRKGLFTRFAVSLQYHGSSFLGFSWQPHQEDSILADGTDLRGYRTVEGRLRDALYDLLGRLRTRVQQQKNSGQSRRLLDGHVVPARLDEDDDPPLFENIQVSSRTDRGVHALHNTLHVDILNKPDGEAWPPESLHHGLNFHLSRQPRATTLDSQSTQAPPNQRHSPCRGNLEFPRWSPMNEMRVLNVQEAPDFMENPFVGQDSSASSLGSSSSSSSTTSTPAQVDWNARFSATERTYLYRILHSTTRDMERDWGTPFEWDRAWRIHKPLDLSAMQEAAAFLQGTHDVSSFQTAGCQRASPVVTLSEVSLYTQPYGPTGIDVGSADDNTRSGLLHLVPHPPLDSLLLTTIVVRGNAFVYRQVRNMVGCLVAVGMGQMEAQAVPTLLASRDRRQAPSMAPAHGLFLARVRHGDFNF
eukprot:scaffold2366_cov159-Amphora_coffeaeformis.AAC.7